MLDGLLIAVIVIGAACCPVMMWLGRRGIGPGCGLAHCRRKREQDTVEDLRARQRELSKQIAEIEQAAAPGAGRTA